MSSLKRHFTVVMNSKEHGIYVSSTPSSAARKAVSKLCADNKNKKFEFRLRETTQGSNKKVYGPYIGYMEKLDKPIELKGRVIRYKPIAKRIEKQNNQVGGFLKVGDKVRTNIKFLLDEFKGKENIFIVLEIYPQNSEEFGKIRMRHIVDIDEIFRVKTDRVEKINNNSEAFATFVAPVGPAIRNKPKWHGLLGESSSNSNSNNVMENPAPGPAIRNKPKWQSLLGESSSNSNSNNVMENPAAGPAFPEASAPRYENINENRKKLSTKVNWRTLRPRFVIDTVEDLRSKKFNPLELIMDENKRRTGNKNHYLFDFTGRIMPEGTFNRKIISFIFRKDITEEKLYKFLRDEQKKSKIDQKFTNLGIAHEVTIFLDIPYIYEGESLPRYERVEYLKYFPPEHLASQ